MLRPAAGIPFPDPVFKTSIVRITDAVSIGKPGLFPDYAKRQAWNSDESLLLLRSDDGSTLLFDGATYAFLKELDGVGGEDLFWHPANPDLVLYNPDHALWTFNVRTGERSLVFDFVGYDFASTRGEGHLSRDASAYAVVASTYNQSTGDVTIRKLMLLALTEAQGGAIQGKVERSLDLPQPLESFDWVSISPSGKFVVVDYADDVTGQFHGVEVYDRQLDLLWQKPLGAGHSDLAVDGDGEEVLVIDLYDPLANETIIMKYRLSNGESASLLTIDADFDQHISCRSDARPGWCTLSTFDYIGRLDHSPDAWLPFEDEVFDLNLDGTGDVQRIAHHHSRRYSSTTPDSDRSVYWAEPHATASRRGDRILFGSNWGLNVGSVESIDAYVIDLRTH